jgi:septum site-determining protein MinC
MSSGFQIKGTRDGLLVSMGSGAWEDQYQVLIGQLEQQAEFLRGARLAIDVGETELKAAELGQLSKELADRGLSLWAVLSDSPATQRSAQDFGLATQIPKPAPAHLSAPGEGILLSGDEAILVRRTLRSGHNLQYAGHVVVIGDVNPGAQVIAGGNIIVWGRLRGMAHAGAAGDEGALVCALDLAPTQLRIAGAIAVTPKRRGKPQPELARLENGQVVAETWDPKKERI